MEIKVRRNRKIKWLIKDVKDLNFNSYRKWDYRKLIKFYKL